MLTVKAPAKINLTLEVLRKRPDGFHDIKSVFQAVDLCDTLTFKTGKDITFRCDMPAWSAEKSLVIKTIDLLKKETRCSHGVTIEIEKRIPLMSGLGGDSSDAAALLRGLNQLWKLELSPGKLHELAARLGSDVVFFLSGGTALAEGRGEILTPLLSFPKAFVVLIIPDIPPEPGKTGRMYAALKSAYFTDGKKTEKFINTLCDNSVDSSMFFNTFENIAFDYYAGLKNYKEHLMKLGASRVHLAGSGPSLFIVLENETDAVEIYKRYKNIGMNVRLAGTCFKQLN
jgi:4-diphosphocytidyl-2-C-methyl-D-erythritol kinase